MYIDSHAHLTAPEIATHVSALLERAKLARISYILNICTDPQSLKQGLLLAERYPHIKNAGATTPHDVASEGEASYPIFERAARGKKLCAIGETGLDYHYKYSSKELQKQFLIRYLHLAEIVQLPTIFHCRDAFSDLFAIADVEYKGRAVLHCFTGSMQEAKEVLKRGWYLSLSGIVTFKKSSALRDVAQMVPLSQLLIETDTPYLAPQSRRGEPNEPAFLPETAGCIANAKRMSIEMVMNATAENAKKLFGF